MPATPPPATLPPGQRWDVFCRVIDNYGDIGVCWRLAAELSARGANVRLRVDNAQALTWMAPSGATTATTTNATHTVTDPARPGTVSILPYDAPWHPHLPPDAVIEAFGCEAPGPYLAALARHDAQQRTLHQPAPVLINLEYLSAESYVLRCHRLPSPIGHGPGAGLTRWFFYPGFTPGTGGLIRETDLPQRQATFDRTAWRTRHGLGTVPADHATTAHTNCAISLFCYEPPALGELLTQCGLNHPPKAPHTQPTAAPWRPRLLITPGRATAAVQALLPGHPPTHPTTVPIYLPPRTQPQFDEMLWACDLNLVRGEDSLTRALWAGQPFVWHIYPQHDNAHHAKLHAFLDWLQAPPTLRDFHHTWNGTTPRPRPLPPITPALLHTWRDCTLAARDRLLAQPDLISQLQGFVSEKS